MTLDKVEFIDMSAMSALNKVSHFNALTCALSCLSEYKLNCKIHLIRLRFKSFPDMKWEETPKTPGGRNTGLDL